MNALTAEKQEFVESIGRACEQMFGFPRMAGRIWGVLLITDREYLSSDALMELLGASRGSISTLTRMLEGVGVINRVTVAGERRHFFRATDAEVLIQAERASLASFIQLMHSALHRLGKGEGTARSRLTEFRDFMEFISAEYEELIQRWHKRQGGK
jgi:DNA-binding transcriptional regulator GbsR (MarR family)